MSQPQIPAYLSQHVTERVRAARQEIVDAFTQLSMPLSSIDNEYMTKFFGPHQKIAGIQNRRDLRDAILIEAEELKKTFVVIQFACASMAGQSTS